jgi:hypothetical protein
LCGGLSLPAVRAGKSPVHAGLALAALLLAAGGIGCAGKRAPSTPAVPAVGTPPYSASITLSLTLAGRGFVASGGCAAVPGENARVEMRDPAGATRLLLLLGREEGMLIAPAEGLAYTWSEACEELPWRPGELLALFSGTVPGGGSPPPGRDAGPARVRWKNAEGRVRATLTPAASGPFPFSSAEIEGPGRTALRIAWSSVRPGPFGEAIFRAPPGIALLPSSPSAILRGVRP